jgi:hypothetical protein
VIEDVPLVMPADGALSRNRLYVAAPHGIEVRRRGDAWEVAEGLAGRSPHQSGLALSAESRLGQVSLAIQRQDVVNTVVEAAWVQTYLAPSARWERAVFLLTSDQKQLELTLPDGVDFRQVEVLVGSEEADGRQRVPVEPLTPEPRLRIPLPGDSDRRQGVEVQYGFLDPRPPAGRLSLELPRLAEQVWVQKTYWELLLPPNEHLIVAPEGLTGEYRWGWTGSFWGRKPLLGQAQLEAWAHAPRAGAVPEQTSRYLFSSLTPVGRCELRTANRWQIVLIASSAVLALGLLLIYVPAFRHPALLLVAAIALLAAIAVYPGPVLLAAQAASLGVALTLLGGLLNRLLGPGRVGRRRPDTPSSVFERGSTQAQYPRPVEGESAPTETGPAPVPVRTSDSPP